MTCLGATIEPNCHGAFAFSLRKRGLCLGYADFLLEEMGWLACTNFLLVDVELWLYLCRVFSRGRDGT